jgi:hypothetical protein
MTRPAAEANSKSLVKSSLPFKNSKMSNMKEMITEELKIKNAKFATKAQRHKVKK